MSDIAFVTTTIITAVVALGLGAAATYVILRSQMRVKE